MIKKFFLLLVLQLVFSQNYVSAVTTVTGCDGGDFRAGCSLAELDGGGTILIDGVLFDNWDASVAQGSLNVIQVTAVDDGSLEPGPGLIFNGPGVSSNTNIGFEMNYDVSTVDNMEKLTGYDVTMNFSQLTNDASGFAATEIIDNDLKDSRNDPLEIGNPEPTVDQTTAVRSDVFTDCDNSAAINCPIIMSKDFRVTTNLDVSGGASGSVASFSLTQRFSLFTDPPVVLKGCHGGDFDADCSLAELRNGGSIQVDDILFNNWNVNVVDGSLRDIKVTAVGDGSVSPGPGLKFQYEGSAVVANDSVGFEAFYDVSHVGGASTLRGYLINLEFEQLNGNGGGFAAMQLVDNILNNSEGQDLLIANPEPTVNETTSLLKDYFTSCNNGFNATCPLSPDSSLPRVTSQGFNVSINLDVGGRSNGSFTSFSLVQRFSTGKSSSLCFPVKGQNGNVAIICL